MLKQKSDINLPSSPCLIGGKNNLKSDGDYLIFMGKTDITAFNKLKYHYKVEKGCDVINYCVVEKHLYIIKKKEVIIHDLKEKRRVFNKKVGSEVCQFFEESLMFLTKKFKLHQITYNGSKFSIVKIKASLPKGKEQTIQAINPRYLLTTDNKSYVHLYSFSEKKEKLTETLSLQASNSEEKVHTVYIFDNEIIVVFENGKVTVFDIKGSVGTKLEIKKKFSVHFAVDCTIGVVKKFGFLALFNENYILLFKNNRKIFEQTYMYLVSGVSIEKKKKEFQVLVGVFEMKFLKCYSCPGKG